MSKQIVEGKIAKIFVKDFGEQDQYGNQYAVNVNINDQWYGLGKKKKPHASVKIGDGWYQLQEGDEIEAVASSREYKGGTYYNIRTSDITVKEKSGNGSRGNTSSVPSGDTRGNNSGGAAVNNDNRQASIMRQSAMGYAAQIVAGTLSAKSNLDDAASEVVRIAAEYFVPYAEHGVTADETRKKEENELKNQQASQQAEDDGEPFDDDLPF
ncbi:hypothetical protein V6X73_09350 [Spiribacter sp. 390]|uniref:Single-stranded DNA-binding protein n=1 Tax=Spiribacter pallidus TaxID=1987936 RepID=A0ABV3TE63_9GAMM